MAEEVIKKNLSELERILNQLFIEKEGIEKKPLVVKLGFEEYSYFLKIKNRRARKYLEKQVPKIKKEIASIETVYSDFENLKYSKKLKDSLEHSTTFKNYMDITENLSSFLGELDTKLKLNVLKEETKKRLSFVHY